MQVRMVIFPGGDHLDVVVWERNGAITVFLTTAPA